MTDGAARSGVGLHYCGTDRSMPVVDLAVAAEARGLDALFLPEHTHVPVSRRTPWPGEGELPDHYLRLWDPLVALAFVAARTDLVIGTCVALPGGHDPIAYAKAVATLDVQSGGRLVLGVGFGWIDEELEDHGIAPADKHAAVVEKVELMKRLWSEDVASYDGRHVRLSPSWAWPKPCQRPHPPILLGGAATPTTFRRIAAWADGWIPMTMDTVPTLAGDLERLRAEWDAAGRDQAGPRTVVMQVPRPTAELRDVLAQLGELGVELVLVDVPSAGPEVVLPLLDGIAAATR
jgi:probable F420-dependent oxidoreductase